jgi:hypothetical protein
MKLDDQQAGFHLGFDDEVGLAILGTVNKS